MGEFVSGIEVGRSSFSTYQLKFIFLLLLSETLEIGNLQVEGGAEGRAH